jgi:hypothetical protein
VTHLLRFNDGDCVRVDSPDETDPDHDPSHGAHGQIIDGLANDAKIITASSQDSILCRVAFETTKQADFRRWNLRSPTDE